MNIFSNNQNQNQKILKIKLLDNKKLKKIKKRNINQELTNYISTLSFSLNHNFITEKKQNHIYVLDIHISNFILNITPNGLTKISKAKLSGIEDIKKKIEVINKEKEKSKDKEHTKELSGRTLGTP